ncbi:hypothetical protein GCM10028793_23070 [Nocardiopsis oceani]
MKRAQESAATLPGPRQSRNPHTCTCSESRISDASYPCTPPVQRPALPDPAPPRTAARPGCPPVALHHPQRTPSAQLSPSREHPSCRRRRAQRLPRLGGHLAEYRNEHAYAADVQAQNPQLIVWFGEQTGSFWVASSSGLAEVPDAATLDRLLPPVFAGC